MNIKYIYPVTKKCIVCLEDFLAYTNDQVRRKKISSKKCKKIYLSQLFKKLGYKPPHWPKGKKQSYLHKKRRSEVLKGHRVSFETKLKISKANKGKIPSQETREKMSISHRRNPVRYWLGKSFSQEHLNKLKMSASLRKGENNPAKNPIVRKVLSEQKAKENNPNWKGGITSKNDLERVKFRKYMQLIILERDSYTCQLCGSKKDLQVDHIKSWADYPELRFESTNCRTICMSCHYFITFGKYMPETIKTWGYNFKIKISKII